MKKTDNTKLITVGQLVKELEKYEKKHWDWNVEITAEGVEGEEDPTCIIIGMGLDKEGDLRIEIEEWDGGGDYYIAELLEHPGSSMPAPGCIWLAEACSSALTTRVASLLRPMRKTIRLAAPRLLWANTRNI